LIIFTKGLALENGKRSVEAWLGTAHFPCLEFDKSDVQLSTFETTQTCSEYAVPVGCQSEKYRIFYTKTLLPVLFSPSNNIAITASQ
jgi:hypothetical protein